MPLLYYWRPDNYARDRRFGFGYHLSQESPAIRTVTTGDSVWAFTRRTTDDLYVFAAELIVRAVTRNAPNYRYGKYRVWADLNSSRYFDVDAQPNAEPLIRHLDIATRSERLGQSFQGHAAVRTISREDHALLSEFMRDLPLLDRVSIYPEDEFEARLLLGEIARPRVLREYQTNQSPRLQYLYATVDENRARRYVEELHQLYDGRCQLCLFDPRNEYGLRLCHGHHIQWLSRGGDDVMENLVLICPNHHAAVHRDDAIFDFATLSFMFSNHRTETVQINKHLPMAI